MKLIINTILCFLLIPFVGNSQEIKFGEVSFENVLKNSCELDSTADAEMIYDGAEIRFYFDETWGLVMDAYYHQIIKIYKNSALKKGNFIIPTRLESAGRRQILSNVKGITYNIKDNRQEKEELDKKSIFNEKVNDNYYLNKITMPNVKEGSIVELQYLVTTPLTVKNSPSTWNFQSDIPVRKSKMEISIPNILYYQMIMGGYYPLSTNIQEKVNIDMGHSQFSGPGIHYVFAMENLPAFKNEKFISSEKDYLAKIEFELSSVSLPNKPIQNFNETWEKLDETLDQSNYWGKNLKATKDVKTIAEYYQKIEDPSKKAAAIHEYFIKEYKWDGNTSVWASDNSKKLVDTKTGNASELNLFMCSIMQESGLKAYPVIISTRENGVINPAYPLLDRFNYTITAIELNDELVYVDAADKYGELGLLPPRCIVEMGRIIRDGKGQFVDIKTRDSMAEMTTLHLKVDPKNGTMGGKFSQSAAGLTAHILRNAVDNLGKEEFLKALKKDQDDWEFSELDIFNLDDKKETISINGIFESVQGGIMPDMIYINALLAGAIEENPLKKKSRLYPVDFGHKVNQVYQAEIEIPEGFVVEALPKPINIMTPDGKAKFTFMVTELNNKINVISRFYTTTRTIPAEDYPYIRELYDKIVEKHADQIVLKKAL